MHEGLIVDVDRTPENGNILAGSAIVCRSGHAGLPMVGEHGLVDIWFEGNLNDAVNLNSFFEKILCAAGRMMVDYPTIARRAVPPDSVRVLATWDLRRSFVTRIIDQDRWRQMLDHPAQEYVAPPQPEGDVTDRAELVAQMNKVGFRHLNLIGTAETPPGLPVPGWQDPPPADAGRHAALLAGRSPDRGAAQPHAARGLCQDRAGAVGRVTGPRDP